uniref:Uncharacterized protein n=1 Tax=Mus musculus TaxID=10090 RepID=Q8C347_MOUSE|nr:unnamed protein product [Mus musculus]
MGQNFNVVFEAGLGYMGPCRKNNGRMKKPVLEIPVWNALYKKVSLHGGLWNTERRTPAMGVGILSSEAPPEAQGWATPMVIKADSTPVRATQWERATAVSTPNVPAAGRTQLLS